MYETRIEKDMPMDTEGLEYKVSDSKNIARRYLAKDAKDSTGKIIAKRNELVSSDVVSKLNKGGIKNIFLQSPLTDPTPGEGFSAYSYGVDYEGNRPKFGDHIGVKAAHTITEPSLNLAMKAFHTGGAMQGGAKSHGTAFDAMDRVFRFNKKMPDKASLSPADGKVRKIKKSSVGGWEVTISAKGKDPVVYVDMDSTLKVKVGDHVKKGDFISGGTANPHEYLEYNGIKKTQKYLVDKIDDINGGGLDRREIETVVRGVTNTTRILSPGSNGQYTAGDVAPLTSVNWFNSNRDKEALLPDSIGMSLNKDYGSYKKGTKVDDNVVSYLGDKGYNKVDVKADKIEHEPFLFAGGISAKPAASDDWIARMAHNRVRDVLEKGTTQGWEVELGTGKGNPFKDYITGEHAW